MLLIVADDLNRDLACYGHPVVRSPNLDRLARRGVRFERAYCNYPVCNPSRVSFLSGLRPETTRVLDNQTPTRAFLPDAVMLPELFRRHGYRTLKVGKIFHTGPEFEDPRSWDVDIVEEETAKNPPREQILRPFGARGMILRARDEETWDGFVARKAVELMEQAVREGKPFFVAAGFRRPHAPYIAPEKYFALYDAAKLRPRTGPPEHLANIPPLALTYKLGDPALPMDQAGETIAAYYASISFMDAQVGVLLDALDRNKLWERTVVVFFSDHGYHLGEHGGLWHKMTLFEEATGTPLIVAAPGRRAGASSKRLVELVDVYPTLTELCELPSPVGLAGKSFVPLLDRPERAWKSAVWTVVARARNASAAAGEDDTGWKKRLDPQWLGRTVRTERWRYTEWPDGTAELYDHRNDPFEYVNLAGSSKLSRTIAELKRLLRGVPEGPRR
ncbi:MAG: sulfatase [Verrucomicrobiae bacterium]|nr:sulfatase [Verrucomicrobiae bacterium]